MKPKPFPAATLRRGAMHAAPRLIGATLFRRIGATILSARIVETEAYTHDDPSSHSYRGPTARNASMFADGGTAYVYVSYGMHHCLNVVTGREGVGEAVLIRAVEPLEGLDAMIAARNWQGKRPRDLANGPGKLCQALSIDKTLDGAPLLDPDSPLFLAAGDSVPRAQIRVTPRIGITQAADWPRRFLLAPPSRPG